MRLSNILLLCMAAACMPALISCDEKPTGVSTKRPVGSGGDEPDTPDPTPGGDIVSPKPGFTCTSQNTVVNTADVRQVMEGFGASDCWLPNWIGQYWTGNRQQLATWLFSQRISKGKPDGIGLSMWRVNLGAGTYEAGAASGINDDNANNRAEAFLVNGSYNWDKCAGQRYFMDQAKQMGVESFVLFSNSPLVQWTLNGQGRSDSRWEANLKEDCYDDFADYMATVAQHFVGQGYNVTHVSPVNEPQYNWDGNSQEGSGWLNRQIKQLAVEMDKAFKSKGISTRILVPEAAAWNYLYEYDNNNRGRTSQIQELFDPASENYIGDLSSVDKVVAGHSYWTFDNWNHMRDVRKKVADAAAPKGLRVWQTEWSMLDKEPSELGGSYGDVSEFDIAQYMSRVIHNDIVMAGCTSWCYWTAMSVERYDQKNRFELIKTTPSGGNYSNDFTGGGNVDATHNLWVLGNYSRFIRPGYTRVGLKANENKDFFGTAYVSPDGKTVVAVYTNYDKEKGVTLTNSFDNGKTPATVTRYTTTATRHLEEDRFNIADNVFLEPASVTTIVYTFE